MPVKVTKDEFGVTSDGKHIARYTLKNSSGMVVQVIEFGATVTSILVPDRLGDFDDVTTGFDTLAEYEVNSAYFGSVVGRVANRIHRGKFTLDGTEYKLAVNAAPNHLHGGIHGFNKKVWQSDVDESGRLQLSVQSLDSDEGYPGTLNIQATYQLTDENALNIDYTAATVDDRATVINLTNHAYFNLAGHESVDIYDHELTINADSYLVKTEDLVPSGEIASVAGTAYDFRTAALLRDRIPQVYGAPGFPGYDVNYCLSRGVSDTPAATLVHRDSGRVLRVFTDQPGLQLYTGNHLNGIPGKLGASYGQHSSLALETQNYPDAINHANFPSCVLRPGDTYKHHCCYQFSILQS